MNNIKQFLQRMIFKFYHFMRQRNGYDALNYFMVVLITINYLMSLWIKEVKFLNIIFVFIFLFRLFSKNISQRSLENKQFLRLKDYIMRFVYASKYTDRIFSCPHCKQRVRVLKTGKTIIITCPSCQQTFTKKS